MKDWIVPDKRTAGRVRWMYHTAVALLAVHFVLVYTAPDWLMLPRERPGFVGGGSTSRGLGDSDKLLFRGDRTLLWGGERDDQHFDVTEFRLKPPQLNYGLGREAFPALIKPEFLSVEEALQHFDPGERVLLVRINGETRIYSVPLLQRHEVVNDVVGGVPIFAAYCVLADLGAVYDRRYGEHTLTFAVSGYTYGDPEVWDGMQAFVLWDRDTESLWWPPIGKAVSGPLIDRPLKLLDEKRWAQTTLGRAVKMHPDAKVLAPEQRFRPPQNWPELVLAGPATQPASVQAPTTQRSPGSTVAGTAPTSQPAATANGTVIQLNELPAPHAAVRIAPRWGENAELD